MNNCAQVYHRGDFQCECHFIGPHGTHASVRRGSEGRDNHGNLVGYSIDSHAGTCSGFYPNTGAHITGPSNAAYCSPVCVVILNIVSDFIAILLHLRLFKRQVLRSVDRLQCSCFHFCIVQDTNGCRVQVCLPGNTSSRCP